MQIYSFKGQAVAKLTPGEAMRLVFVLQTLNQGHYPVRTRQVVGQIGAAMAALMDKFTITEKEMR